MASCQRDPEGPREPVSVGRQRQGHDGLGDCNLEALYDFGLVAVASVVPCQPAAAAADACCAAAAVAFVDSCQSLAAGPYWAAGEPGSEGVVDSYHIVAAADGSQQVFHADPCQPGSDILHHSYDDLWWDSVLDRHHYVERIVTESAYRRSLRNDANLVRSPESADHVGGTRQAADTAASHHLPATPHFL